MLLTRRISWHMAHRIYGYDGLCGSMHGHTYSAEISLEGPVDDKSGMVCDFGEIKNILVEVVDGWFDHSVFLWEGDPLVEAIRPHSSRMVVFNGSATAENLARVLFDILDKRTRSAFQQIALKNGTPLGQVTSENVRLSRIRLWETEKSSVEIDRSDPRVQLVDLLVDGRRVENLRW